MINESKNLLQPPANFIVIIKVSRKGGEMNEKEVSKFGN
jgi:hypothetical protein